MSPPGPQMLCNPPRDRLLAVQPMRRGLKDVESVLLGEQTPARVRFAETRKLVVQMAHCLLGARTPWARLVGSMAQANRGCICEESPLL